MVEPIDSTAKADQDPTAQNFVAFGPDLAFDFEQWLSHPDGLGQLDPQHYGTEVAIVGAGIAGMVAAYELMKLGLRPVIYEADRIGGRLKSEPFPIAPEYVADLGGMRYPVSGKSFFHYVNLCGLSTKPFPNPLTPAAGVTVVDLEGKPLYANTLKDLPEIFSEVASAWHDALEEVANLGAIKQAMRNRDAKTVKEIWDPLVKEWDDRTFYDFVASSKSFSDLSYRHREIFGQVGFGTGGWDADFPNTMLEIFRVVMCEFEEDQQLIEGGSEQLPLNLWTHQPDKLAYWPAGTSLASLHNGAHRSAVTKIERLAPEASTSKVAAAGQLAVTDRWGEVKKFDAALVTAQNWLLTTGLDVAESLFSQKVWMALDRTSYMQSSKTFVLVDRPFWHEVNSATGQPTMGMTLTDRNTRGTYLLDNGPDKPAVILLSYAWAGDASKVLPMNASERADLALDTLKQIYPKVDIRSHIIGEPITVSWEADPLFLGAFKRALPGHYRYNRRMHSHFVQNSFEPEHKGIFLAGDDISWTPGWAEGAVHTALNSVWGIMNHFGGQTPKTNPGPGDVYDKVGPLKLAE